MFTEPQSNSEMSLNPAENLIGQTIKGRWQVVERKNIDGRDTTGGYFSVPYRVIDIQTGGQAFMKVINLSKALLIYQQQGISTAEALHNVSDGHLFEVHLAEACKERKLRKIISVLDHGDIPADIPLLGPVGIPYIVFEYAECDAHSLLSSNKRSDLEWHMATLHQVAVGIQELHHAQIAHHDLKRSNVVFFGKERETLKLIDLGRAVKRDRPSRNDLRAMPCQPINAPPESLYGFASNEWDERHFAADLYMLGSLTYSMLFDVSMTFAIFQEVPLNLRPASQVGPKGFSGSYKDILPVLDTALSNVLLNAEPFIDLRIRELYLTTLRLLCNPDPEHRGHPKNTTGHGSRYSVERFISVFRRMQLLVKGVL
jgi:serine/threonine protein kinase